MSNYKDLLHKNLVDKGTTGTTVAVGTTAQRGSSQGQFRFNTNTGLAEYYDGTAFKGLDTPPVVTSIDDGNVDSAGGGDQTIIITGSNFSTLVTVTLVANSGSNISPATVSRDSSTQITITEPKSSFVNANEPYDVKVENDTGLSGTLADSVTVDNDPVWQTSPGALTGSPFADDGAAVSVTLSATDVDGDPVTYALHSGALPSGITLNTTTGVISGNTPDETSNVTYNFTVRATANTKTTDRAFSMQVMDNFPPVWTTPAGSLGIVYDSARATASFTVVATDVEGDTITYSVVSGSLPTGASLNTSTGVISTFTAVGGDTTSTFTIRASATGGTADREFSIEVKAPVTTAWAYTGADQSWTIPTGLTSFTIDMKGGAGGNGSGGSGGTSGRTQGTRAVTAGQVYKIVVGQQGIKLGDGASYRAYGGGGSNHGGNGNGGGGYTGIFLTSISYANAIGIAGGGGGASNEQAGGAGGGSSGAAGGGGGGGGQSGGGSGAGPGSNSGTELLGGDTGQGGNGGGGGGGYWGGGGGRQGSTDTSGGGGSGYVGGLTSSSTSQGGGVSGGNNGTMEITY